MRILYGKKKAVPEFCPRCGPRKLPLGNTAAGFGDCLAMYLNMWKPVLASYRGAPWAPAWWGECGSCTMDEAIFGPSIFEKLLSREEWKGGTFVVPFK